MYIQYTAPAHFQQSIVRPKNRTFILNMENIFKWQWVNGNKEQPTCHTWINYRSFPFFVIVTPLAGTYQMRTDGDGKLHTIRSGEALVVPPNVLHSVACPDCCLLNYAHLLFRSNDWPDPFLGRSVRYVQKGDAAGQLRRLIAELFDSRGNFADSLLPAAEIFSVLYRESFRTGHLQTVSEQKDRIQRVILFMQENLQNKLTRTQLARLACLSETRFHYVFKEFVGSAPMEYLIRLRLRKAKELLTVSDDGIQKIACSCGWPDPVFFARQFKRKEGITPHAFRRRQRAKMLLPQSTDSHNVL